MVEEKIQIKLIEEEMKESYIDYAMSVIVGRALPDVCDGLKPVHKRILFAMKNMGMWSNKPTKKSARIVGEVLGKYHPHGDLAVYDALVRMAQEFSLRYPLIKGQGNFGSVDGDSAAASRYTEAKLSKIAEELLADIDKKTVNFVPTFDGEGEEPVVLPARIPNLLVNGSAGIAVGMATNIPPHNISETCSAVIKMIDNPGIETAELMENVLGPDFPTGGIICGKSGILRAYEKGRGSVIVRSVTDIEEKGDKKAIIVTEIPYQVNKARLIEAIADLVRSKKVEGIYDIRDESDRKGMRVVIELKKNANPDIILNQLHKHTQLQTSFGINMLALVAGQPKLLSLKEILHQFILHRQRIVTRRTKFDLEKAEERAHILIGLKVALNNIDAVVKTIKSSKDVVVAKQLLMQRFKLSDKQSVAILEMRLQKLTSLETTKIMKEYEELIKLIVDLKDILGSDKRIFDIIKDELKEIISKYGDERRTQILDVEENIEVEDLIKREDVVVTVTHEGYAKKLLLDNYKQQKRGGKGIVGTGTKEEDIVEHLFTCNTHDYILFFTNKGKVYWLKTYRIPTATRYSKGSNLINLIRLDKGEVINAIVPIKQFNDTENLIMATKNGLVKKTVLSAFSNPRKGGIIAIKLRDKDELVNVKLTDGSQQLILGTRNGMAVKFDEKQVRQMGRNSSGVRGIRLVNDKVVGMEIAHDDLSLLTVTENGYGKRSSISDYRLINRGGKGVINIKTSLRNGKVVGIKTVADDHELMFITKNGIIIRTTTKDVSVIGRNTQGVRLMKMKEKDKVVAVTRVIIE
ncbi:MAG: DNA gyrase subunit A [Nanoarchaeota archaeon]|nr:DNA gyrase subunit A [Nanoarchaeota archaeon]MBU1445180.1 DNA gyrase subunit A [Nanoarchaeota archaeon]MBU2420869.1 DNA gyrase subunit A [Nanoarchaeota archaeon]MBU2475340.1 DNA gyrase subunit A [Nanoarchaeota archaeon]MBU3940795.1 DNA gyrase subunit A [Nanoarchaeota archaeon]